MTGHDTLLILTGSCRRPLFCDFCGLHLSSRPLPDIKKCALEPRHRLTYEQHLQNDVTPELLEVAVTGSHTVETRRRGGDLYIRR